MPKNQTPSAAATDRYATFLIDGPLLTCIIYIFTVAWVLKYPEMTYSDPPFAATLIKASVPVNVLLANYIEVNQAKMQDIVRIA